MDGVESRDPSDRRGVLHDPGRHPARRTRGHASRLLLLAASDGPARADVQPDRRSSSSGARVGVSESTTKRWPGRRSWTRTPAAPRTSGSRPSLASSRSSTSCTALPRRAASLSGWTTVGVSFRSSRKPCRPASARSPATPTSICALAPTFRYLERELRLLVQEDILASDTAPPPELIERYGAGAQILAPVVLDGRMVGFVSVHNAQGPRRWSGEEIAAAESAARRVAAAEPKP